VGGNRFVDKSGYVHVKLDKDDPYYPMADKQGYVLEHRLEKAKEVGRCLESEEIIHHENGNRTYNPPDKLKLTTPAGHRKLHPKPPGRRNSLTREELKDLLSVITSKRDTAIFLLAYNHGLRPSEIGLIKMEDIDLNRWRVRIRRVQHSQGGDHPLFKDEVKALKAWLKERKDGRSYLFLSSRGKPISRRELHYLMEDYGRQADVPLDKRHFSVLKHSIVTHLLEAGANLMFVQYCMGHKNIQNTVAYAQTTNRVRDDEAKRLFSSDKIVGI
jgi:type 1 fimbriae regulatory protein FimB